jgi:hypothetical protein
MTDYPALHRHPGDVHALQTIPAYQPRHLDTGSRPRCTCQPAMQPPSERHTALCAITIERSRRLHLTGDAA